MAWPVYGTPISSDKFFLNCGKAMQGINLHVESNLGFSVLPKDTSTRRQEEPGFNPPTLHGSLVNLLFFLSHSRPIYTQDTLHIWQVQDSFHILI